MINTALIQYDFKANRKFVLVLSVIMGISVMVLSLVLGKKSADPEGQVLKMLSMAFFDGGLLMMVSIVFCVILSNSVLCSMVNTGSMACILSSPVKRTDVSLTQSLFILLSSVIFNIILMLFIITAFLIRGFDVSVIIILTTANLALMIACSGIAFMFACIFNTSKKMFACSGIIFGLFYILKILVSYLSKDMDFIEYFKYINLLTLYDTAAVIAKSTDLIWQLISLSLIGFICFAVGNIVFSKKDLPL